jgi:hypothetical protein
MQTLEFELPDAPAARLEELVEAGWLTRGAEIGRLALEELLRRRPFELQDRFPREDIAWALDYKGDAG